ncbi:hypothetical protein [Planctomyces sp. SH-PL62]|uniref:hypothetical protein n=1 Tax=Planctomyces sp. SH-PL62 TaxID=1636152 RepID=UPI00078EEA55|nr:hypothetical protein [Planctomyces sp. SH-PL62]AMV37294.1 hypothetical protein VT85_07665 [Planctomyces sp. SH-PL62]
MARRTLVCALSIACWWGAASGASAQSLLRSSLGSAGHGPPRSAPVPPGQEIEMLDPNADPVGNPAVELTPGPDGRMLVDVPRLVLVHRYYYSGDRSFQFKMMPGGPCILVVNHPRTGERLYLEATLPPGAPRVYYDAGSIEYDYGPQGIKIFFGTGKHGPPKIVYRQGARGGVIGRLSESGATRMKEAGARQRDEANGVNRIEGAPEPDRRLGDRSRRLLAGARQGLREARRTATDGASRALRATPLGSLAEQAHQEGAAQTQARAEEARLTEPAALDAQPTVQREN